MPLLPTKLARTMSLLIAAHHLTLHGYAAGGSIKWRTAAFVCPSFHTAAVGSSRTLGRSPIITRNPITGRSTKNYVPNNIPYRASSSSSSSSSHEASSSSSSSWVVPDRISIPTDQLEISFTRASGAGGQNVNKVSTKVELRLHVPSSSHWLPQEVIDRLLHNESHRISKEGYLTVTSQEYRTQIQNRKEALHKLEILLKNSWARPKVRKMRVGLSTATKVNRKEEKRKHSIKKESRGRVDF